MGPLIYGGIAASLLAADFLYRYWRGDDDVEEPKPQEMPIPRVEDGTPIPLIFGRCRVRAPILAWNGVPETEAGSVGNGWPTTQTVYRMDMFFVCGIGMNEGNGTNGFHNMWAGEEKFFVDSEVAGTPAIAELAAVNQEGYIGSRYAWFDGNASQEHADSGGSSASVLGDRMLVYWSYGAIPGFRGYISVFLHNLIGQWYVGSTPSVQQYSFEVSSYVDSASYPCNGIYAVVGQDVNPVNVLWDLLQGYFGKVGIPVSYLDMASFTTCGNTLYGESHGYSRCIEDSRTAAEVIQEILKQIDAVLYEDMTTGTLKLKLIREDYVIADLPRITRDNCVDIQNFSAGGWNGLPNAIRVVYESRDDDYREASEFAKNPANAAGQDGQVRMQTRNYPGVKRASLASMIAWRELAWASRPMMKCRAILDRSFIRLNPGDAVRVQWTNPDISNVVFRVVSVDRGTLANGQIAVELVQDAAYTHRQIAPLPGGLDRGDLGIGDVGFGL